MLETAKWRFYFQSKKETKLLKKDIMGGLNGIQVASGSLSRMSFGSGEYKGLLLFCSLFLLLSLAANLKCVASFATGATKYFVIFLFNFSKFLCVAEIH